MGVIEAEQSVRAESVGARIRYTSKPVACSPVNVGRVRPASCLGAPTGEEGREPLRERRAGAELQCGGQNQRGRVGQRLLDNRAALHRFEHWHRMRGPPPGPQSDDGTMIGVASGRAASTRKNATASCTTQWMLKWISLPPPRASVYSNPWPASAAPICDCGRAGLRLRPLQQG
jgi:hypothetical protein